MPSETNSQLHCKRCNVDFKRPQDLKGHMTRIHTRATKSKSVPSASEPQFNKTDIIAILNVKINALTEVKRMLENL